MAGSPKAGEKRTADELSPVAQRPPPTQPLTDAQEELLKFVEEVESKIQMHHLALSTVPNTNATRLRTAATLLGAIAGETSWVLDALAKEKERNTTSKQAFNTASKTHKDVIGSTTLTIPTPFDTDDSSSSSSDSPDPATSTEVSALAKMVQQLSTQVATISRQVMHIAERPIPRPKQPTTTTQPVPPKTSTFTYAQAAAAPAPPAPNPQPTGANPQPMAPAPSPKQPKKQRQPPPPPKVYAKDPTLVFSPNQPIPATHRKSGASLTTTVRHFIASLPTADRVTLLSAVFNAKGNIVCTFAPRPNSPTGPSVETILDRHAMALGGHLATNSTVGAEPPATPLAFTHSRVRPRSTLRISMVPTKDQFIPGGATHTPEELRLELFQNPAFRGLEIVDPPHFTCRQDRLPELEFCPVSFSFVDPAGETRARLLKKRRVWLFGQALQLSVPPVRPALAQCDRCQKLGHTSKGCKAQTTCAYCAGRHATKHHRSRCTDCATDAIPVDQDCPHPPYCANCKGIHQATDPVCPNKKKYAATAAKDSATPDPSMEL